jgi:hydroxylamine dehydrogenase
MFFRYTALISFIGLVCGAARGQTCVECHRNVTPSIVSDWQLSKHSQNAVACDACHGEEHKTANDAAKAKIPTPETCAQCHADRVAQYKNSKHAAAWAAMKAMPTFHYQPMAMTEGMKAVAPATRSA